VSLEKILCLSEPWFTIYMIWVIIIIIITATAEGTGRSNEIITSNTVGVYEIIVSTAKKKKKKKAKNQPLLG
jgi:hypothetical protein